MRRALLLLGLLSCKVAYERYCESSATCPSEFPICDTQQRLCVGTGTPDAPGCMNDDNCPTGAPHCLVGVCVQCRDGNDCGGTQPVCEDHACRGCKADDECPATLCDTDLGSCVAANAILYVRSNGSGTSCISTAPCAKISDAVAVVSTAKHWIQVADGGYADAVRIQTTQAIGIVGIGDVRIIPSTTAPAITLDTGANVLLRGLRLFNGTDPGNDGVRCNGNTATTLRMSQLRIDDNAGVGVNASRCTVTLERSEIFGNAGGGLLLFQSGFTIRNNFIYRNGTATGTTGGAQLIMPPASPRVFEFNTVTKNMAMPPVGPGLHCDTAVAMSSVIVWDNGASPDLAQVGGNCTFDFSDIGGTAVVVPENIKMDPMFVDAAADDYHIAATSPCVDKGELGAGNGEDFDGQSRPNGSRPDIGADENY